ncbi:hypothetical protein MHH81_00560 [Psychrobacillus sp. FSL H8-0484]|uniref:hypothetical protein n=1 Tax=Psychrobacillus sp. FSL H8-0484 TaxID=2921390 RepID=UPI0030FB5B7C
MWVMQSLPQKFFCDELCAGAGRGELRLPSIRGGVHSLCSFVPLFLCSLLRGLQLILFPLESPSSTTINCLQKTGVEKDSFFYTRFNLWAYWTAPFLFGLPSSVIRSASKNFPLEIATLKISNASYTDAC